MKKWSWLSADRELVRGTSVLIMAMAAVLTLQIVLKNPAAAEDSFRCETHLITLGQTKADVLAKCGPPSTQEYQTWTYSRGSTQFVTILRFSGEKLTSIEQTEDYGSDQPSASSPAESTSCGSTIRGRVSAVDRGALTFTINDSLKVRAQSDQLFRKAVAVGRQIECETTDQNGRCIAHACRMAGE